MNRALVVVIALVACGKSEDTRSRKTPKTVDDAPRPVDPACAAKVKDLEPFIAALALEKASHEINYGWAPVVIDRPAAPISKKIDNVTITPKTVEAYDASEGNRPEKDNIKPNTKPTVAKERLAKVFEMKLADDRGPDDMLRLDVDKDATWGEVVRIVDAAVAAGYTQAVFAFEATSKLVPPAGVEPLVTSADVMEQADHRFDAMLDQCRPWRGAVRSYRPTPNPVDGVNAMAKAAALGIAQCNCPFEIDEIRSVLWKTHHWLQAHTRAGVDVKLGDGSTIELPKATPWSEAHAKLLATSGPVKLVAK